MTYRKRERVQFFSDKPSRTQQHMKNECDVNSILEKYRKTGMINHIQQRQPKYADFSSYQDFKSNLDMVKETFAQFEQLPAHLRKRFQNNPEQLIEFLHDDSNYDEAVKLGLVTKAEPPKATNDDQTTNTASPAPTIPPA